MSQNAWLIPAVTARAPGAWRDLRGEAVVKRVLLREAAVDGEVTDQSFGVENVSMGADELVDDLAQLFCRSCFASGQFYLQVLEERGVGAAVDVRTQ
jgi:hypothetical protein